MPDTANITKGLDELAARRTADALSVELGPLTSNEEAALVELRSQADAAGCSVDNLGRVFDEPGEPAAELDDDGDDECDGHEHDPGNPSQVAGFTYYCDGSCKGGRA